MGRVDSFRIAGLALWFNTNDHEPPHFHAERPGEWELRVFFLEPDDRMFDLVYVVGKRRPPALLKRRIASAVATHRLDLFGEWATKVGRK